MAKRSTLAPIILALLLLTAHRALAQKELRKEVIVDAPVAAAWHAWTTTDGLTSFFATAARMELRAGGPFEILFDTTAPAGLQGSEGCMVIGFEPERLLSFTWNAPPKFANVRKERTRIDLHFEPIDAARTKLTLVETGWGEGEEWNAVYGYFDKAWSFVLGNMKEHFAATR